MGDALADSIAEGEAGPRDWRTSPLIGLRFQPSFLHDGRASTVEEAITAHEGPGSEANGSLAKFKALSAADRSRLVSFVSSL
jgi:CxxC motif-containing protein (DUF1111 family)